MIYKAILLDLDHTLYDYESANAMAKLAALQHISEKYGKDLQTVETAFLNARQMVHARLRGTGASHNRLLYYQKTMEILKIKGYEALTETHDLFWRIFFNSMELVHGVMDFLRRKNSPICIVTDFTAEIQFRKLQHLKLLQHIDFVVSSEEAGIEKPAPQIFTFALEKLALQASEVCMVGDDWEKDVLGAMRCGITPIWINHRALPPRDAAIATVSNFSELSDLLNG